MGFLSLFRRKKVEKKNVKSKEKYSIICYGCGWEGTVSESTSRDKANDSCPHCGEGVLTYKID